MKKILYSALALPLLFACSSEDFDNQAINNDPFAGIEKVDATFSMDEATTRMDKGSWDPQEGDLWGFAWLTDAYEGNNNSKVEITGNAFQNHNLIQTSGIFTPQTSIYVGKYYLYRPYDAETVSPKAIDFKSLMEQPMTEGYASTTDAWKALAASAINIADKWTEVTPEGHAADGKTWDKAGTKGNYKIFPAMFSNQTGLDLKYEKNNPKFTEATAISGATDINYEYPANSTVGAAKIYGATVQLVGAANSFSYAPLAEPNGGEHSGTFWAAKKNLGANDGFTFPQEVAPITLTPTDVAEGISTDVPENKAWFWFNSLPNTAGEATLNAENGVITVFETSYGTVTVAKQLGQCAYVFDKFNANDADPQWIKLIAGEEDHANATPKEWGFAKANRTTFINHYGNHKGKYALTVDFSTGDMNNMHIKSDSHLQDLLKFIIASGKVNNIENTITLLLDNTTGGAFNLSKISIALLQTINAGNGAPKVLVKACQEEGHHPSGIKITQYGQEAIGQGAKKDVPSLKNVFAEATRVDLSDQYDWTWTSSDAIPMDDKVTSITLLNGIKGTLNVTSTNVEMTNDVKLIIAHGATMTINEVTTVKNDLTNRGTINVPAGTELRAYGADITNDATSKTEYGVINNSGVIGVTYNTNGTFNNYGLIDMQSATAITLLTTNQTENATIGNAFDAQTNKLGTVKLPSGAPNALVSVNNAEETGFIEYTWTGGTTYTTPNNGVVKYNTLIVNGNIAFTEAENEIKYIKFTGVQKTVTNSADANLHYLKGIIVDNENHNASIIIEKNNRIVCSDGSHLGSGATVYNGGTFTHGNQNINGTQVTDYLGTWSTDQIVVYNSQVVQQQDPGNNQDGPIDVEP